MQFKLANLRFKPTMLGTLLTLVCIPIFIKLGFWQYDKAALKQQIQREFELSAKNGAVSLTENMQRLDALHFHQVMVEGEYLPKYQILLDNQVENSQPGYHVITPLRIVDSQEVILVNRGWIPSGVDRDYLPEVTTPTGLQQVVGMLWKPSEKFFTLESTQPEKLSQNWQTVWQHLDMQKYNRTSTLKILPVIIKLDEHSQAGGFVRHWQMPTERIVTHLGYAYQWFGFAIATLCIYIYMSFHRKEMN